MTTLQTFQMGGWYETNSEGIATVYLSITDEGMVTGTADTPANTSFRPRVLNAEQFSIKRTPIVWPWGQTTNQSAAFGQLQIDNYDGAFDFLISADLRDATIIINLPNAGALLTGTAIASAPLICTAILDNVRCDSEDIITVTLKDTIARLDKTLPCRFNPPFVDSAAANQMIPLTFGACRNIPPLLIDSPNRLYQLHDANIPNVTLVSDKAAPLDPNASPPQYTPALTGSGLQLQVLPQGKLVAECSSFGTQAVIPGANDVLAGNGAFPNPWLGVTPTTSITSGAVTSNPPDYRVPTANTAPYTVGQTVFVTDGTNSVRGVLSVIVASTRIHITIAGDTETGVVISIATGSPIVIVDAPTSWTWSNNAGSGIVELTNPPYPLGATNGAQLISSTAFYPAGSSYSDQLATSTAILKAGSSYRLTFGLYSVTSQGPLVIGGMRGGILVATALSANAQDYITGIYQPITTPSGSLIPATHAYEFTVPAGADRKLYFIAAPSSGSSQAVANGTVNATIFNVKLQLLGQYTTLPLSGIPFANYCTEVLVSRAGEASTIFNAAEAVAIATRTDASIIPFGVHFDSPPNILDMLRMPLDSFCATTFTDATGQLRFRRLIDPSDPTGRVIKCNFTTVNVDRPIAVSADNAANLTTIIGARRNWSQFSASDFVTDQTIVPQDVKARYMRQSQFNVTSSQTPAGQYNFAIKAPIFDSVIDLAADAQVEIDRVVGIFSPKIYSDGTFVTGKRRFVTFTAHFDDPTALGVTTTCNVNALMFGDIVSFTYPSHGFNATPGMVCAWEIWPFAQKITLTIFV